MGNQNRFAAIAANAYILVNWNLAQEIGLHCLGELFAATGTEDVHARAIGEIEIRHILDDAQDGYFQGAEHVESAAGIFERDKLRKSDDDCAAERQSLRERKGS